MKKIRLTRQQSYDLHVLAANCGIDARGLTPQDVEYAHSVKRDSRYSDQHDARLDALLRALGVRS